MSSSPDKPITTAVILRAIALVMLGIFLLDLMAVFIRMLSDRYPPSELAAFRNFSGHSDATTATECQKSGFPTLVSSLEISVGHSDPG